MNNRILFAAGRGARVQTLYTFPNAHWGAVQGIRTDGFYDYRIHPDDEHLAYGPVSSALRAWAFLQEAHPDYVAATRCIADDYEYRWSMTYKDELHRSLFLLLLAEALADSGL